MLAIGRRSGECIHLFLAGHVITVRVYDIDRGTARLAVDAPPECKILRGELLSEEQRKQVEKS